MKAICSVVVAISVAMLATNSWGASNLNLSKSNINREFPNAALTTASVNLGPSESVIVYTIPERGDFILTQFCASPDATGGIRLDATGLGGIAQTGATSCFTFSPGVSIPKGSTLSCSTGSAAPAFAATTSALVVASYFCTISGMQTTK
jgi:hypothetical protein